MFAWNLITCGAPDILCTEIWCVVGGPRRAYVVVWVWNAHCFGLLWVFPLWMCLRLMRDTIMICSFQVNMVMWLILEGSYRHRCSTLPRASERDV